MAGAFPRLHVITDTRPGRRPLVVVRAAVAAAQGIGLAHLLAVQVRVEDDASDRQAYELTREILAVCRPAGVLCLVNDRLHVALAAGADGGHVGADDLPVTAAHTILNATSVSATSVSATSVSATSASATSASAGPASVTPASAGPAFAETAYTHDGGVESAARGWGAVLGVTCREAEGALAAVRDGASYLGVGPAFGTVTKTGLPAPIGAAGVGAVAQAVPGIPVIAIGGVTVSSVPNLFAAGAHGVAVVGAVSGAADPGAATVDLLRALSLHTPGLSAPGPSARRLGESGLGESGLGVPGLGVPGLGVPGLGVPGLGESGLGVPGLGVPGLGGQGR